MLQPVILCGGSGTRLWPLSRKALPKQFVPLIDGKSLLALTLERVALLTDPAAGVVCVGAEDHRFLVREAISAAGVSGTVILEPVARNTAAAMAMAALQARSAEQLLLFCPSDHHIPDATAFTAMVQGAIPCAQQGGIVTFGVLPTFPSTGYGYIDKGQARTDGGHAVGKFIEKPAADKAQQLLLTGNVLWNAGIFLCRADIASWPCFRSTASGATWAAGTPWPTCARPTRRATASKGRAWPSRPATTSCTPRTAAWWPWAWTTW
jgi:mannose-1-phosphate guanylyltransferase/mannose-6-phosphate isomerase